MLDAAHAERFTLKEQSLMPRGSSERSPQSPIQIRPAEEGDMPGIRAVIAHFPQQLIQRDLPRRVSFFVAVARGKIVGCCALQVYSKRLAEVRSLAVDPGFQDRGIASKLVEQCAKRAAARGVKELFAVTGQTAFFERLGFATFHREKTAMFLAIRSPTE